MSIRIWPFGAGLDLSPQVARDDALLRRYVRDRDLAAFDEIVARHLSMIRAACRREIGNRDLAEDAVSVALLVFAEKAATIRSGAVLGAWLLKTAQLAAKNVRRREETHSKRLDRGPRETDDGFEPVSATTDLNQALTTLSERQRTAVLMRFAQDRSLREIGNEMGVSEDAARMIVNRSLTALRKNLRQSGTTVGPSALALILREDALQQSGPLGSGLFKSATPWTLARIAALGAPARHAALKPMLGLAVLVFLAVPTFGRVADAYQESAAIRTLSDAQSKLLRFDTLQAVCDVKYAVGAAHGAYRQKIYAERPDRYRIETGAPYKSAVICDGTDVHMLARAGQPGETYTKMPASRFPFSGTPQIDAFLGRDLRGYAATYLPPSAKNQGKNDIHFALLASVERDGVVYKVVEARYGNSNGFIRFFIAPNGLLEGVETKKRGLVLSMGANGEKTSALEMETSSSFLARIQLGRPVPSDLFAFDEPRSTPSTQPNLVTAGSVAPDLDGVDPLTGRHVSLKQLSAEKKAVLVDFWFAGCRPCRGEMPDLNALQKSLGPKGLDVLCVDGMDTSVAVREIFRQEGLTMTPLISPLSPKGNTDQNAWNYGVRAYPTTILVGPDMRIVWISVGAGLSGLREALAKLGIN